MMLEYRAIAHFHFNLELITLILCWPPIIQILQRNLIISILGLNFLLRRNQAI